MILSGIDYSYTSPAICIYDTSKELKFENLLFYNINDKKKLAGNYDNIHISTFPEYSSPEERYRNICSWASNILLANNVKEACIEGYSFGASSGLVFNIAENASLIKQFMSIKQIPFDTPTPSQVKKNFTGKGNSKKDVMVNKFHETFPQIKIHEILNIKEMAKPIDDIVDSFAVMLCHKHFTKDTA
jgi:Holliday junction resolvasome RuvABC endonuclease subunit